MSDSDESEIVVCTREMQIENQLTKQKF